MRNAILFSGVFLCIVLTGTVTNAQTLNEAIKLMDNEQYEEASVALKSLMGKEPSNLTYYYYLGENYLLSDNADSALIIYEKGAKLDAANPLMKIGHAKYDLDKFSVLEMKRILSAAEKDAAKAKAEYEKLANKGPEDEVKMKEAQVNAKAAEARVAEATALVAEAKALIDEAIITGGPKNATVFIESADALIHFKNKDMDKAKSLLEKALALQPKNPDILILFGDIYSELNNGSLSADYYNKALDIDQKSVKSIVNKGRLYKRSTNYDGAAEQFENAIKIDDNYAPAHRELGEVYYKLGKLSPAKEEYRKYLDLSKNNCGARVRYASFLYVSKDYAGALNELAQQKNCDPNNITTLRMKAYCNYEVKDSAKALAAIKDLFAKVHEDKLIAIDYEYYGKILSINSQDSLAAFYLHKAFMLDNTRCDLLNEIWKIYDRIKNYAEAARTLEEKRQNCKSFPVTDHYNLGRSYFFNKDFQKADTAFAKVNELTPNYASGWLWRANSNANIDTSSALGLAKPHYEKYIEVAISDSDAGTKYKNGLIEAYRYLASYYYLQLKDKEKAKEYIRIALELDSENKDLKEILKGFEYEQQKKKKP